MSELIQKNDNRATIRWKLLIGASAMALTAYVASNALARAEDANRPQLWIDLGAQTELVQGFATPFSAPFMTAITPLPDVYRGGSFIDDQRPSRFAFGAEGKITFQPQDSDWKFSAGIRYGRSHSNRHTHHQTGGRTVALYTFPGHVAYATYFSKATEAFRDSTTPYSERHMVVDFRAGRDVGIGLLGSDGSSTVGAGARLIDFRVSSSSTIYARPYVNIVYPGPKYELPSRTFYSYTMTAHAARSFKGIGPSLYWDASAALAGNKQDGELMLDWNLNAALLFGRQKAKTDHTTQAHQEYETNYHYSVRYGVLYSPIQHNNPLRSREITVPNIGGSVGLSVKYPNFKISVGYRYDTFLKAMDTGIDARKTSNLTFNGPYASFSVGLGD